MWPESKLETAEAYALGVAGALRGIYQIFIKEPFMELRLNNQSIDPEALSEQAKADVARTIAFNRDTAIGQLALLGLPGDHPYKPKVIEETTRVEREQLSLDNHHGFRLEH